MSNTHTHTHTHTHTLLDTQYSHFCVLVSLLCIVYQFYCLPDSLLKSRQTSHAYFFVYGYFWIEGWEGAYFLIRCSKYLLLLACKGVPLLIIFILARQPFTKLIVLNFTRFSSRTNCFISLLFTQISLPALLYHDLLIRGVDSLVI